MSLVQSLFQVQYPFTVHQLPVLYKAGKGGAVQYQTILVEKAGPDHFVVVTKYGQVGGAEQEARIDVRKSKGQPTVEEQAIFDAKSKWNQKKDRQGYDVTVPQPGTKDDRFYPMLAKKYNDRKESLLKRKTGTNTVIQVKLNGVRMNAHFEKGRCVLLSRRRSSYEFIQHIVSAIEQYVPYNERIRLDGELFSVYPGAELGDIAGLARQKEYVPGLLIRTETDPETGAEKPIFGHDILTYVIYDCVFLDEPNLTYSQRYSRVNEMLLKSGILDTGKLMMVDDLFESRHVLIDDDHERHVDVFHDEVVAKKFEGCMVRVDDEGYEPSSGTSRAEQLLKYKKFFDEEFLCVGVGTPQTGRDAGTAMFLCRSTEHVGSNLPLPSRKEIEDAYNRGDSAFLKKFGIFTAQSTGELAKRKKEFQEADTYVGQMVTVQYQSISRYGIPEFPKMLALRNYE